MTTQAVAGHKLTAAEKALGMSRTEADKVLARMKTSASYGWLHLPGMKVDPRAQRLLRRPWIKRHIPLFDPNQIGTIVVSRRADGTLWVIDGQHRVELLRACGWGETAIYCEIFDGLTIQEEAALFLKRNDRISVRAFDKFMASLTEQNEAACAIDRIVRDTGLRIAEGNNEGSVAAVTALQHVYSGARVASEREGAASLKKTLHALIAAWDKAAANFQGPIIEGVGLLFLRYGSKIDQEWLVAKLAKITGGAAKLLQRGKAAREVNGGGAGYAIASVIVENYNKGLRGKKKLDGWR